MSAPPLGVILAGGQGRRLGGVPKGLERVADTRIVDRVASALRGVTDDLLLSANDSAAEAWLPGVPIVRDAHPRGGGLAGVEAALTRGRDTLVVAWDMPFVSAPLLRALVRAGRVGDADAVIPRSDSPHGVEPFCAFYAARALAPLTEFLDAGGGPAADFLSRLGNVRFLTREETAEFGDPARLFLSVNTASDLARARAIASQSK